LHEGAKEFVVADDPIRGLVLFFDEIAEIAHHFDPEQVLII
jgi:hypothetical protein